MSALSDKLDSSILGTRLYEREFFSYEEVPQDFCNYLNPPTHDFSSLESLCTASIDTEARNKIKVAIATEDIVGPVKNGGIGTTYYYLSKLLSSNGYDVTILYLRGDYCESETIEHWVQFYAELGVTFTPVADAFSQAEMHSQSNRWIGPAYNLYQQLKAQHFHLVHISEWRGSSYYCLMAKRLGIAFNDTRFVIKSSSPWVWNRLYGGEMAHDREDLIKMHMEKSSIELGDIIVGGSHHLLNWMITQGYRVDPDKTYVQPNVLLTDDFDDILAASDENRTPGSQFTFNEIVFFGRLEERKGLVDFCDAIDIALAKTPDLLDSIDQISFMGKEGANIKQKGSLHSPIAYIHMRAKRWPTAFKILTEFQQYDALKYLSSGPRLAVMPSKIENSSLAVYECLLCKVPFVASITGGTPELVEAQYQDEVLCDAHPISLAELLTKRINEQGVIAPAVFDNTKNNQTWLAYHDAEAAQIDSKLSPDEAASIVDILIYAEDLDERLEATLESIQNQSVLPNVVHLIHHQDVPPDLASDLIKPVSIDIHSIGYAYNQVVMSSKADAYLFIRPGMTLNQDAVAQFVKSFSNGASLVSCFYQLKTIEDQQRGEIPSIEPAAFNYLHKHKQDYLIGVSSEAFHQAGGFNSSKIAHLETVELVNQILVQGSIALQIIPEFLYTVREDQIKAALKAMPINQVHYRTLRPFIKIMPPAIRNICVVRSKSSPPSIKDLTRQLLVLLYIRFKGRAVKKFLLRS